MYYSFIFLLTKFIIVYMYGRGERGNIYLLRQKFPEQPSHLSYWRRWQNPGRSRCCSEPDESRERHHCNRHNPPSLPLTPSPPVILLLLLIFWIVIMLTEKSHFPKKLNVLKFNFILFKTIIAVIIISISIIIIISSIISGSSITITIMIIRIFIVISIVKVIY